MEKKSRSNTVESSPPSPQEAAASLDPLVQPINDQEGQPIYIHRRSSIFFLPSCIIDDHTNESFHEKKCRWIRNACTYMERYSGILYSLLAACLFTCSNFMLKQLTIVMQDVMILRFFIQTLISFGFIQYKGYHLLPESHRVLVLIRSLFAGVGSVTFYIGLTLLPLPDLTTIRYTQVVWTALIALILFRERINLPTIIASLLTLIGVVCVAQPTFLFSSKSSTVNQTLTKTTALEDKQRLTGMLVAGCCAISISMSIVLNKYLIQKQVRQSVIMFYFTLVTVLIFSSLQIHYYLFSKSKPKEFHFKKLFLTNDFLIASIIAILQFVPMVLAQKSIKREHPSIISVVQSSDILFALILQNMFSSIKTNLLALMGSLLVLTSIFIVGGHKLWLDRQNRTCLPPFPSTNIDQNATKKN